MINNAESAAREYIPSADEPVMQEADPDPTELAMRFTQPLPSTSPAHASQPYGDKWDVLWLGHCRTSLQPHHNASAGNSPPDRLMLLNDPTVPAFKSTSPPDTSGSPYPPQSRIYHRAHSTLCTLAYAVTQQGARKILYEHGIRNLDKSYDFALSEWCDGETKHMGMRPMCLTSSPAVFWHFWGDGCGKGDIAGVGRNGVDGRELGSARSVRGHLEALMDGEDL